MTIKIYTDGACSGNPGIGGWGVVILSDNNNPVFLNGGMQDTTNNQMELQATIQALKYFNKAKSFNFISTAGGAFLEFLEGKNLPGIKAIN